jgi:hypothetical protein
MPDKPKISIPKRQLSARLASLSAEFNHLSPEEIENLLLHYSPVSAPQPGQGSSSAPALRLIEAVNSEDVLLWHTSQPEAYATVKVVGHQETMRTNSTQFRGWLRNTDYQRHHKACSASALNDAIEQISVKAKTEGEEKPVFVRVGHAQGNIYIDMCDSRWRVIEVTPTGWSVIDNCNVHFERNMGALALPEPERGGSIADLWRFVNVVDWRDRAQLATWLIFALWPKGPYPILVLHGRPGSAKSTAGTVLRSLIDPFMGGNQGAPESNRDMQIAASNCWLLAYNNISFVETWFSDACARLATGSGLRLRKLHTDREEIIFESQRPILMNGIEEFASKSDFLDRSLVVRLPEINEDKRIDEATFEAAFKQANGKIFGSILHALSSALCRYPSIHPPRSPRMADFYRVGIAAEEAIGLNPGEFSDAYLYNKAEANNQALESSAIYEPLRKLLTDQPIVWDVSATDLLANLESNSTERTQKRRGWPKTPKSLGNTLERLGSNLRAAGIEITRMDRDPVTRRRMFRIEKLESWK